MASVSLANVCVDFPLLQQDQRSLKRLLSVPLKRGGRFGVDLRARPILKALKDVNLELNDGDRLAVIGPNGAGKSTLLRVLAGIYPPTAGVAVIEGRVATLLSVGLGLRDDVSGYENIAFCLLLLGATPAEIAAKRDEIIAFSDLADYIHLHVGAYSTGMRLRLAFAIATSIDPEILVIDEIFGGGDAKFSRKAEVRMMELVDRSHILVFASHMESSLERFCNKCLWLDSGRVIEFGSVNAVVDSYMRSVGLERPAKQVEPPHQNSEQFTTSVEKVPGGLTDVDA